MNNAVAVDYLSPDVPAVLPWHDVPVIKATASSLAGYGCLVDNPDEFDIEIVRWPAQGWRSIDAGTGDEGGTVAGVFHSHWHGQGLALTGSDALRFDENVQCHTSSGIL